LLKKMFTKKRMLRAGVLTVCLLIYLVTVSQIVGGIHGVAFFILLASCILVDYLVGKAMKTQALAKYFYEGR
jgi:uncharacterized protein (DUF58 family)